MSDTHSSFIAGSLAVQLTLTHTVYGNCRRLDIIRQEALNA